MAEDGKILVGKLALELAMLRNNVNEANKILGDIGKTSKKNADNVSKVYAQMATNMKKAIDKVDQAKKKASDSSDVKKTTE